MHGWGPPQRTTEDVRRRSFDAANDLDTVLVSLGPVASPGFRSRGGTLLPFPSLHSTFLPSPPLEVGPLNPARGSGERCKLPQWGLRRRPSRQTIWCISGPKGTALVATVLWIFIGVNLILWCIYS